MGTKGNSHQHSQYEQAEHSPAGNQADAAANPLSEQLEESEQKVAEITLQKEDLNNTCENQADYIRELTAKIQTLQTDISEKQVALEFQRKNEKDPDQTAAKLDQLTRQLEDTKEAWRNDLDEAHVLQERLISRLAEQTEVSEKISAQANAYREQIEQLKEGKEKSQEKITTLEQAVEQSLGLIDKQTGQIHQFKTAISELQGELTANQDQLKGFIEDNDALKAEVQRLQTDLEDKTIGLEDAHSERQRLIGEQQNLQKQLDTTAELTGNLKGSIEQLNETVDAKEMKLQDLQEQLNQNIASNEQLNKEQQSLRSQLEDTQKRAEQAKESYESDLDDIQKKIASVQSENDALNDQLEQFDRKHAELLTLSEQKSSLEFQIKTTSDTLDRIRHSYQQLRQEHDAQTKILDGERTENTQNILLLNQRINEMADHNEVLSKQNEELETHLNSVTETLEQVNDERSQLLEDHRIQTEQLGITQQEKESLGAELINHQDRLKTLASELADRGKEIEALEQSLELTTRQLEEQAEKTRESEVTVSDLRQELATTQDLLNTQTKNSEALQAQLRESDQSNGMLRVDIERLNDKIDTERTHLQEIVDERADLLIQRESLQEQLAGHRESLNTLSEEKHALEEQI
ncbi:MAG: coiled-coil domain-containing protein, partial [Planctomycetota bacterium]